MSRCFPFPHLGYEKKAKIDDTDLLTKEKQKEKKRKKDKKGKEKREGEEKKDKDRSKEKHRKKKDRKNKHKERDRNKEKNQTLDEKRVEGKPGFYIGEKSGSNSLQNNEIEDSKCVRELARRIREEEKASGSQTVQKNAAADQRAGTWGMAMESDIGIQSEEKKKVKDDDTRKANGQRNQVDTRGLEKPFGQNLSGLGQERVEGITKPVEKKDVEKQMEGKEKSKHKEGDSKGDKHKSRDREKKEKSKDKDRNKEKKKEKAKEMTESSKDQSKVKESGPKLKESSKDSLDFRIIKPSDTLRLSGSSSAGEGNLGKRKELEINGFLLDNGNRPNKFQRLPPSSHPAIENGRKMETSQPAVQFTSEKQGPANNHRVDFKEHREHKINGLIVAQQPNVCSAKPSSANVLANENGEAYAKSPHPDTKYLSQILSVPKMEEWHDFNDQEWLFSSNHMQLKPNGVSYGVDGTPEVWAEALWLESADISALPYVIPY